MKIKASVKRVTGKTTHFMGTVVDLKPVPVAEFPPASAVQIEDGNGGFYLFYLDAEGECFADGWYETLADAKTQAKFEFEIDEDDWQNCE